MSSDINIRNVRDSFDGPSVIGHGNTVVIGTGRDGNDLEVPVRFRRPRKTVVGDRSARWVATAASLVSATCAVLAVVVPTPVWQAEASSAAEPIHRFVLVGALVVMLVLTTHAWRFRIRRARSVPKIGRPWSPFRSLIPVEGDPGVYRRTTAEAICSECRHDRREAWGRIVRGKHGVYMRCSLVPAHRLRFRENSIFVNVAA